MRLSIKSFRKGTTFYKGFREKYNTLKNERFFYIARTVNIARTYMRTWEEGDAHVCEYTSTKQLRLLNMNDETIDGLLTSVYSDVNSRPHKIIKFAFGKASKNEKLKLFQNIVSPALFNNRKNSVSNKTRLSIHEMDKKVGQVLCPFLKANNLDGYYFHGTDEFHTEIMICDASGTFYTQCRRYPELFKPNRRVPVNKNLLFNKNKKVSKIPIRTASSSIYKTIANVRSRIGRSLGRL